MPNIIKDLLPSLDKLYLSVILLDEIIIREDFKKLCLRILKTLDEPNTLQVICLSSDDHNEAVISICHKLDIKLILINGNDNFKNKALTKSKGKWVIYTNLHVSHSLQLFAEFKKLSTNTNTLCIVPKTIYRRDLDGSPLDKNPLAYMFKKSNTVKSARLLSDHILLTEEHCFLNLALVKKSKLNFDKGSKYNFNDPQLINELVSYYSNYNIVFCGNISVAHIVAQSYNPVIEGHEDTVNWALEYLKDIPIKIINTSRVRGRIPVHIQCLMIYEVFRRINFFIDRRDRFSLLNSTEQDEFIESCKKIMEHVDEKYINTFIFKGFVEEHKVAFLNLFKNAQRNKTSVYVSDISSRHGKAQFFYMSGELEDTLSVNSIVNGKSVKKYAISYTRKFLFDKIYCVKNLFWIDLKDHDYVSFVRSDGDTNIKNGGKSLGQISSWLDIRNSQIRPAQSSLNKKEELFRSKIMSSFSSWCNSWLIVDRPDKADDNAEHFYRYIKENGLHNEIYFALSKKASDWKRLESEGFNLIDYGSEKHLIALTNCRFLISSQAGHGLFNPQPTKSFADLSKYRFIFLQHGIIMTDISKWLNNVRIKKFITSTPDEFNFISGKEGNYKFTDNEVCLTGMPRHDFLLKNCNVVKPDTILIMPTWRRYLTAEPKEIGGPREPLKDFLETDYAKHWITLLKDKKLKELSLNSGLKVKFAMHPNLSMYVNEFIIPDYIEVIDVTENFSYSKQILETAVLLTDYSSVAFDAAVIDRPVIYFQFDKEEFSSGKHTSIEGYFDFEDNGFGPICYENNQVLVSLEGYLTTGESKIYQERRDKTYPQRNGNSCQNVYNEIVSLDL